MADEKTPNRRLPLPDPNHAAIADAGRLAEALRLIDSDIAALLDATKPESVLALILGDLDDIALGRNDVAPTAEAVRDHVAARVAALVDSSPATLDTLKELADALGDDPHFASTVASQIGLKADQQALNAAIAVINEALNDRYTRAVTNSLLEAKADQSFLEEALANKRDVGNSVEFGRWAITTGSNESNLEIWRDNSRVMTVQSDGNLNTSFFGFLNLYVEGAREAAKNWAYSNLVQDVRLTGWWELGRSENNWVHAPTGGVVTAWYTRRTSSYDVVIDVVGGRHLQFLRYGNWYTVGVW